MHYVIFVGSYAEFFFFHPTAAVSLWHDNKFRLLGNRFMGLDPKRRQGEIPISKSAIAREVAIQYLHAFNHFNHVPSNIYFIHPHVCTSISEYRSRISKALECD